ncbi:hypothetical protein ACFWN1_02160 [Streptomyces sp. NPDC058459]|uniref:hypothetical protein n=1 Tax=Streptomyces sp. NPDC058459 TaxID=3346508 RepID=UPI003660F47B
MPAALLLASFLAREPDPDGFAGLWPTSWLSGAVLILAGAALVAGWAHEDLPRTVRSLLMPVLVAGAAARSGFLIEPLASGDGWTATVVSVAPAASAPLGGRRALDAVAWLLTIAAYAAGTASVWAWRRPRS